MIFMDEWFSKNKPKLKSMEKENNIAKTSDDIKAICFGRDDLLAVAEQIIFESGLERADGEELCEKLAMKCFDYLMLFISQVEYKK